MTQLSVVDNECLMEQGQFEIIQSLGSGATAEVFKAKNTENDNYVALKTFLSFVSQDPESLKRLRDEIQILKTFDHPNVVKMYGEHMFNSQLCLELELVDGHHLRDWMATTRNPLMEVDLWILVQVARGLGAVHEKGIIHRDLKPENILISKEGDVKLSDFGLAKELNRLTMTRLGLLVGSLGYMAPEVTEGEKSCIKSDLFSFGAIAYELLSGQPPFPGDTAQAILKRSMEPVVPLSQVCPHVPPRVANLVDQCLSLNKEDRPESIWAVASELMGVLNKSGLLPQCKELLAAKPSQAVFKEALKKKRENLLEEVESVKSAKKVDKKALLSLANEFQRLFPEDATGMELLALLKSKKEVNWKHPILLAPLLLLLMALGAYGLVDWKSFKTQATQSNIKPEDDKAINQNQPIMVASNQPPVEKAEETKAAKIETKPPKVVSKPKVAKPKPVVAKPKPKPAKSKPKVVAKPKPQYGYLSFEVDDDVDIFIAGKRIPRAQLKKVRLKPGVHKVKMVKAGFDPINNEMEVRAGKTTTIRAKGGA